MLNETKHLTQIHLLRGASEGGISCSVSSSTTLKYLPLEHFVGKEKGGGLYGQNTRMKKLLRLERRQDGDLGSTSSSTRFQEGEYHTMLLHLTSGLASVSDAMVNHVLNNAHYGLPILPLHQQCFKPMSQGLYNPPSVTSDTH